MKSKINKGKIKDYKTWTQPKIVENALELLDKEISRLKEKIKWVHFCFSTDPFICGQKEVADLTLEMIVRLNNEDIRCTVLTKGIYPEELATEKYSRANEYGITLVLLDPEFQKTFEPGASPLDKRLESLKHLHEQGLKTWVSIEPYPTPNIFKQDFNKLLEKVKFVDKIIFGSWNYDKRVSEYKGRKEFYLNCSETLKKFCEKNGIEFHVKIKGREFEKFKNTGIFLT